MLPFNSRIEIISLIDARLGTDKPDLNYIDQDFFEWLAVLLIHRQQETREHGQHHRQRCQTHADMCFQKKKQRYTDECTAAEANQLALGQVEHHLRFDFGQVFGNRYISHEMPPSLVRIEDGLCQAAGLE